MPIIRQSDENKVAHAMATHSRMATAAWRHKIRIKHLFEGESTHELIDRLCQHAVKEIKGVIENEELRRDQKDDVERGYFISRLQNLESDFDVNIGAGEDETVEDRQAQFNYMLSELYDVGDTKIELRDGSLQKFCWID